MLLTDSITRTEDSQLQPIGGPVILFGGPLCFFVGFLLAVLGTPSGTPVAFRIVSLALALQALLLTIDIRPPDSPRSISAVPAIGHTGMTAGSLLVLEGTLIEPGVGLLAYTAGFSLLVLHTFWMRRRAAGWEFRTDTTDRLEAALLGLMVSGLLAAAVASFAVPPGELLPPPPIGLPAAIGAAIAAVLALALLAQPPTPPVALEALTGTGPQIVQHGVALVLIVNVLLLATLLVTGLFLWVLGLFLAWLTVAVTIEYAQIVYAHRRRGADRPPPPDLDSESVTVIVTAASEASVLPESLEQNLAALSSVPFLLVPAASSDDGTLEIAAQAETEHENVRVLEGTSGSKAGDLNQAWPHVETPYALLLDADETINPESVARSVQRLREEPTVGVVQGRKAAANPDTNVLTRFVSVERQHSTWIDHPFVDEVFGAGHFGGSVAVIRTAVPPSVGGWSPDALTEDIDFTLRLYQETDWQVTYDEDAIGWEAHPATLGALLGQRVRWARGWAQAATRHLSGIFRTRSRRGWRQTLGIGWLLSSAISAPFATIFPVLLFLWVTGIGPTLPATITVPLAVYLLPARAISFGYAAIFDPEIQFSLTPQRVLAVVSFAYAWVCVGWFVQLHALYLQFAGAPRVWYVTEKTT